jgi:Asp-tRNA(Asn)/Glu-tRNA(Gln) amidotransferase A subunit family amidase
LNGESVPAFGAYTLLSDAPSNAGLACMSIPSRLAPSPLGIEIQCRNGADNLLFAISSSIKELMTNEFSLD